MEKFVVPRRRWLGSLIACLVVAATGCGGSKNEAATKYVALGDSIAFGTGATSRDGYVSLFRDRLETGTGGKVTLDNRAVPLLRTQQLLDLLRETVPTGVRDALRGADLITLSIGGNDLLDCADDDYTSLDQPCLETGVARFREDFPLVLREIRTEIGAKGRLYVMTVYNPYPGDHPNYAAAEAALAQINAAILDPVTQAAYSYKVADVHADFAGRAETGDWKTCVWTHFCEPDPDVHPTDAGHAEIARLHQSIYP